MTQWPPSPFPTSGLNEGDTTNYADLLQQIRALAQQPQLCNPRARIAHDDPVKPTYVSVLAGLVDVAGNFPRPNRQPPLPPAELKLSVQLSAALLEVTEKLVSRVDGILVTKEQPLERLILSRFFQYSAIIDEWQHTRPGVLSEAETMRENAIRILSIAIKAVVTDRVSDYARWQSLRSFRSCLRDCISAVDDICTLSADTYPIDILLFRDSEPLELPPHDHSGHRISIVSHTHAVTVALSILQGLVTGVLAHRQVRVFYADLIPRLAFASNRVVEILLDKAVPIVHLQKRASLLEQVTKTLAALVECSEHACKITQPSIFRLLLARLEIGEGDVWHGCDHGLVILLQSTSVQTILRGDIVDAVGGVSSEQWNALADPLRQAICSYLEQCTPYLHPSLLRSLQASLTQDNTFPSLLRVREVVSRRLNEITNMARPLTVLGKRKRGNAPMPESARIFLEQMGCDSQGSMDIDQGWKNHVISELTGSFLRPLSDSSAENRKLVAQRLQLFIKDLDSEGQTSGCPSAALIRLAIVATARLLDGRPGDLTVEVWKETYKAFALALEKSLLNSAPTMLDLEQNAKSLRKGLTHAQRGVRLAAGRVLVQVIRLGLAANSQEAQVAEPAFALIEDILKKAPDHIKETTIVTTGAIGREAGEPVFNRTIYLLVQQFTLPSNILRSLTNIKLLELSKLSKKSPYSMLAPILPKVAVLIATQYTNAPTLLLHCSSLISQVPSNFLETLLPHYLPVLVATCSRTQLDAIAKTLKQTVAALIILNSADVLEKVFLLDTIAQTEASLTMIDEYLSAAAPKRKRGEKEGESSALASMVKSCIVPLLGKLVFELGDLEMDRKNVVLNAIRKVERYCGEVASHKTMAPSPPANFLKRHILGVISHISGILQDDQGKKPLVVKMQGIRCIKQLIAIIGPQINVIAPQIMTTMQSMIHRDGLERCTLETWLRVVDTLPASEFGPYLGVSAATFVRVWPKLNADSRATVQLAFDHILQRAEQFSAYIADICSLRHIPALRVVQDRLDAIRPELSLQARLEDTCRRAENPNPSVSYLALTELKSELGVHDQIKGLISGDTFDPVVGQLIKTLFIVTSREGEVYEEPRLAALESIGLLGAVDPDRFDFPAHDDEPFVYLELEDDTTSMRFAEYLIVDVLVGIFRSTADPQFQAQLSYAIQELLGFCGFNAGLVMPGTTSVSLNARNRWNKLPADIIATVAPLLDGKFSFKGDYPPISSHPIYHSSPGYRDWIQRWVGDLIYHTPGSRAKAIFAPFRAVLRATDVQVCRRLLPYLLLNILVTGKEGDVGAVQQEMEAVLQDQVNSMSDKAYDQRLLCAQTVFQLMDHLNKFIQYAQGRTEGKKGRRNPKAESLTSAVVRVDSITSGIDQGLMARAAFECKQYARALMNLEQQAVLRLQTTPDRDLQEYYEKIHEIYAELDEPDGMAGISTKVLSPSLEHQIREHESTGRWTAAQSCWEVRLQQEPDNIESHIGLMRCLKNLGHYDALRTHVAGILSLKPDWSSAIEIFHVESAWTNGDWSTLQRVVEGSTLPSPEMTTARLLLAMRNADADVITQALARTRLELGQPISAAGSRSYRRSYSSTISLHIVREVELICQTVKAMSEKGKDEESQRQFQSFVALLDDRLESALPSFRTLEPILSMRRAALNLLQPGDDLVNAAVSRAWLASSKIARKAGHFQAAYGAMLQARHRGAAHFFIQGCKLLKSEGDSIRALQELDNALAARYPLVAEGTIDLTLSDEGNLQQAKAYLLRTRWMQASERYNRNEITREYGQVAKIRPNWEAVYFHWGLYLDRSLTRKSVQEIGAKDFELYVNHVNIVVKQYGSSLLNGSKYLYQTLPRMLTLWLDLGERAELSPKTGTKQELIRRYYGLCVFMREIAQKMDPFKWLTAFPQIVSRICHPNENATKALVAIMAKVLQEYPQQALWLMTGVISSAKSARKIAAERVLRYASSNASGSQHVAKLQQLKEKYQSMTRQLLHLCNFDPASDERHKMSVKCPELFSVQHSPVLLPLQESFTTKVTPASASTNANRPFEIPLLTIAGFLDDITIMPSLQKPRKIGIIASDGQIFHFLCKPKDDLRKDARLSDFNSVINKLLRASSESRRRQLRIRTYSVVPLNEECGLIEWVRNTIPIRNIFKTLYDRRNLNLYGKVAIDVADKVKTMSGEDAAKLFEERVLSYYPRLFHEWFVERFPEPTQWLACRNAYSRTAAVMSMVGYILGLGDRHCENIMMDDITGDTVHCDFNCLFERGKSFDIPETVPFRLTPNLVDGLGVTGVEGVFRISCEVTMQLLRSNGDCLMSILEAFIHDPLVEWEDEKRKKERRKNNDKPVDLRELANKALDPIQKKLKGLDGEKQMTVNNQVERLIRDATSLQKLAKMYVGWTAWL